MGFLDRLSALGKNFLADAEREFARVTSRHTFERVCQAAFLIARADGTFDDAEKAMLVKVIGTKLPHYGPKDIACAVDAAASELAFSAVAGIAMLLNNIGKAKGSDEAALIMLVALAIAGADGDFSDTEKAMARGIADALGLDPKKYEL
jgi:tellurite resistance protein TerB